MFDIGWSELVVIGVVALIAIGPKELPGVLRSVGQWVGKIKRMAGEFQGQFQEAMREAEVADLKKQFDEASAAATDFTSGLSDPLDNMRKEIESSLDVSSESKRDDSSRDDSESKKPAETSTGTGSETPQPAAQAIEAAHPVQSDETAPKAVGSGA